MIGVPFFALVTLVAVLAKVQLNWPAPTYFTLMILAAYYLSTRPPRPRVWKPWRAWFYPAVAFGLLAMPVLHDTEILYPAIGWADRNIAGRLGGAPMRADPMAKLKGGRNLAGT